MQLKIGIAGSEGKIGKIRKNILSSIPDVKLVDVCDTKLKNKSDFSNLLKNDLDAVFICTPHKFIAPMTIDALEHGLHVFAEKPPGTTLRETQEIKKALKKNSDLKLQFGFNHRYHLSVVHTAMIVNNRSLGRVLWLRGIYGKSMLENWRSDSGIAKYGILLGQGIHMLDLFNLLTGNRKWTDVKAVIGPSYFGYDKNLEENVFAIMKNEAGQTASIHSSANLWKHTFNLTIGFTKGMIEIDGLLTTSRTFGFVEREKIYYSNVLEDNYIAKRGNPPMITYYHDIDRSWELEIKSFINSIKNNTRVIWGNIDDALRVMSLIDRIYRDGEHAGYRFLK
ncbi:MAG: gfo/Idh/MocA family oxidoreductase [Chloroflexi bacterium]|nr:MAG: gfo/Idh/MocA family oxidoreductase [Chloroflexota bacterium]